MKTAAYAILFLLLAGCDQIGNVAKLFDSTQRQAEANAVPACKQDVAEWREEVRLHDGQVVQVWRRATACAGGFPNASRGRNLAFEFKYEPLGAHWKGKPDRDPVSFEIFDGVAYLVLYINDRNSCMGQPPGRYLAQIIKWEKGRWIEVNQGDFPGEKALLNLHAGYWGRTSKKDAKGLILVDEKYNGAGKKDTVKTYFEGYNRFCRSYQNN